MPARHGSTNTSGEAQMVTECWMVMFFVVKNNFFLFKRLKNCDKDEKRDA